MLFTVAVIALAIAVVAAMTTHRTTSTEDVARTFHAAGRTIGTAEMSRQGYQGASSLR